MADSDNHNVVSLPVNREARRRLNNRRTPNDEWILKRIGPLRRTLNEAQRLFPGATVTLYGKPSAGGVSDG